jgi:hypothetical protein
MAAPGTLLPPRGRFAFLGWGKRYRFRYERLLGKRHRFRYKPGGV